MQTIKDLLNKIKWDKNLNKEDYDIYYFDRVSNKLISIPFVDIDIEGNFIIVNKKDIPIHRIKEVRKKDKLIWKR